MRTIGISHQPRHMKQNLVCPLLGSALACLLLSGCVLVMEGRVTPQHICTIAPAFCSDVRNDLEWTQV